MKSTRLDVSFLSQGERCAAWLYLPEGDAPAPVIVMAHGLGAVRTMRLDAFAERFQAAGYACLVFDYRHFGDSAGEPRQLLDIRKQQEDWVAAVACARQRPEVDGRRVVVWGTSFSGGHAIWMGATQTGLAAIMAQCPFTDGLASGLVMNPITTLQVLPRALADVVGAMLGRHPVMVPTSGKPFHVGLMTAADCEPGYLGLVPPSGGFRNEVAARIALQILAHRPGTLAGKVPCPAFFAICSRDSVAPSAATLRHVRHAPLGQIKSYDAGHFDIYVGQYFEQVVADQIGFLHQTVPLG